MNIDWAALGSVFGVSLVVTVALVGLFTLGIVGLSKQERAAAQGGSAGPGPHRRVRLLRAVRGGRGVRDLPDRRLTAGVDTARPGRAGDGHRPAPPRVACRPVTADVGLSTLSPPQVKGELTGIRGAWWTAGGHIRRQERKPVRIRRGPATVTGESGHSVPGSQELSPPVTSNQGADPE